MKKSEGGEMNKPSMSETLVAAALEYEAMVKAHDAVDACGGGYATARGLRGAWDASAGRAATARDSLDAVLTRCTAEDVAAARRECPKIDDAVYYSEKRIGLRM
jgi:G:T/U-mismatch repair DNA glycosylase